MQSSREEKRHVAEMRSKAAKLRGKKKDNITLSWFDEPVSLVDTDKKNKKRVLKQLQRRMREVYEDEDYS
jgi:hypothetical protein